jgi:hypothetical protein
MTVNAAVEPVQPMHTMSSIASAFARLQAELLNKHVTVRVGPVTAEYMAERGSQEILVWLERNSKYTGTVHFKVAYENQLMALYNDTFPWHGHALPREGTPDQLLKIMTGLVLAHVRKSNQVQAAAEPDPGRDGTGGKVWRNVVAVLKQAKRVGEFDVDTDDADSYSVVLRNQHGSIEFDVGLSSLKAPNTSTRPHLLNVVAVIPTRSPGAERTAIVLEAPLPDSVPIIIKALVAHARKYTGQQARAAAEPSSNTELVFARLCAQAEKTPLHFNHQGAEYTLIGSVKNKQISLVALTHAGPGSKHLDTTVFNSHNGTVTRGFMSEFELPRNYTNTKELVSGMLRVAVGDWKRGVPKSVQGAAEPALDTKQLWYALVEYTAAKKHFQVHNQPASAESQHGAILVGVGLLKYAWFRLNINKQISFGNFGKHRLGTEETASLLRNRNQALSWMARSVSIDKPAPLNGGV